MLARNVKGRSTSEVFDVLIKEPNCLSAVRFDEIYWYQ